MAMLYADDSGVVSLPPQLLMKTMAVIMTVYAALGLAVLGAKAEIMSLCTEGMPNTTAVFCVEATC